MKANEFQEWLKTTPEYQTLVFQHGERLFIQRDGEFENLTVRLAYRVWAEKQDRIDKALSITGNYCDEDDAALLIYVLEKALRGASD